MERDNHGLPRPALWQKRAVTAPAPSRRLAGHATGQTADEQAATRGRMEAELATQRQGRAGTTATPPEDVPSCPHTALAPRWDSVADMGNEATVSSYTCQGCNQQFTAAEGRTLLATEAERLPRDHAPNE